MRSETVTLGALVKRINRKLAHDGEKLSKSRRGGEVSNLGDYHTVDVNRNTVTATHVDPEKWGRELGVLADNETVED